jgi:hypothetical protein
VTSYALAQPVPGPRIVPFGETRLASDVLPNGRPAFRVTQQFRTIDAYWLSTHPNATAQELEDAPRHRATDLGNFWCGEPVYAVYSGKAQTIGPDQYGALGIIIDHGSFSSVSWHLNAFTIPRGSAVPVNRGQQIGIVGKTGLGAVCHLHLELKVNGVRIDPEPYLFGAPLVIEDDMNLPSGLKHVTQGVVGVRNRLRKDPDTAEGSRVLTDAEGAQFVQVYGLGVTGEAWNLGGVAGNTYAWVGWGGETWFVAEPLVTNLQLTATGKAVIPPVIKEVPGDCSAAIAAATAPLTDRIRRGKEAAVQIGAVAKSLETVLG